MAPDRIQRIKHVLLITVPLFLVSESQAYGLRRNPRLVHQEEFDTFGSLDCMTPKNGPGRCIPLSDCPTLTQLLENPNKQAINYIRNSTCGLLGSEKSTSHLDLPIAFFSWVCCPGEVPTMTSTTKPSTGADKRPNLHLLPKDCGISNVGRNRVVGGQEAPRGAWPWMAVLLYQFNRTGPLFFQCGGVLITNQHVITASHCVRTGADLVAVRLGEHNLNSPEDDAYLQEIGVRRIIPHERFSFNPLANDVAVLQLERKVTFNDRVRPICLPLDNSLDPENLVGEKVYIAGWGLTQEGGNLSTVLKEAEVPIVSLPDCIEAHKDVKNANVDATVTCTGYPEGGVGSCQGDSGGPLMRPVGRADRFHLLGLVRSAVGCARPGFPAMFTRVDRYIDWILSKLQ